ncbi:hypothetical protein IWZ01DRAFT_51771 [Phyllosticta capitalensis]
MTCFHSIFCFFDILSPCSNGCLTSLQPQSNNAPVQNASNNSSPSFCLVVLIRLHVLLVAFGLARSAISFVILLICPACSTLLQKLDSTRRCSESTPFCLMLHLTTTPGRTKQMVDVKSPAAYQRSAFLGPKHLGGELKSTSPSRQPHMQMHAQVMPEAFAGNSRSAAFDQRSLFDGLVWVSCLGRRLSSPINTTEWHRGNIDAGLKFVTGVAKLDLLGATPLLPLSPWPIFTVVLSD